MKTAVRAACLAIYPFLCFAPITSMAQDGAAFTPTAGDEVVVYTHGFKAENFAEGAKLVEEGFTQAQAALGQTRLNYFIANPSTYEVVVVSFFGPGADVDEWHRSMSRLDVLDKLAPMRREPLALQRYQVDAITSTK